MNYGVKMRNMLREILSFKQYKRMNILFRVLVTIVELPFIVCFLAYLLVFYVYYVLFSMVDEVVEYLKRFVNDEGKEVKHATQFIVYFFGFPVILIGKIFTSIFTIFIFLSYLLASLFGEVITLHGFKFQPFISKANDDYSLEVSEEKISVGRLLVFVIIGLVLLVGCNVLYYIGLVDLSKNGTSAILTVSSFVILGYEIFTILFSVLGFNKKKEIEKKEDKIVITDEVLEEENKGE